MASPGQRLQFEKAKDCRHKQVEDKYILQYHQVNNILALKLIPTVR